MTPYTAAADRIATLGAQVGQALRAGAHLARQAGASSTRDAFDLALEGCVQSIRCAYAASLFGASASLALEGVIPPKEFEKLKRRADDEYAEYVRFLAAEAAQETADHRYEMAREMMGAV